MHLLELKYERLHAMGVFEMVLNRQFRSQIRVM